jgi:hypothetical protein
MAGGRGGAEGHVGNVGHSEVRDCLGGGGVSRLGTEACFVRGEGGGMPRVLGG